MNQGSSNYQLLGGDQTLQMYGIFLGNCIVWVRNIMTPVNPPMEQTPELRWWEDRWFSLIFLCHNRGCQLPCLKVDHSNMKQVYDAGGSRNIWILEIQLVCCVFWTEAPPIRLYNHGSCQDRTIWGEVGHHLWSPGSGRGVCCKIAGFIKAVVICCIEGIIHSFKSLISLGIVIQLYGSQPVISCEGPANRLRGLRIHTLWIQVYLPWGWDWHQQSFGGEKSGFLGIFNLSYKFKY